MADLPPLTGKQQLFVDHYLLNGFNASRAARAAGYSAPEPRGSENVRKRNIRAHLDAHFAEMGMGAAEVLVRIAAHARSDDKQISLRSLELLSRAHGLLSDRLVVDWKVQLEQQGIPAAEIFENLIQEFVHEQRHEKR